MHKILLSLVLSAVPLITIASTQSDDFGRALQRYAKSTAHTTMGELIAKNANGTSWKIIFRQDVPNLIDDRCGYREQINLPREGFAQMRSAVVEVAGQRIEKALSNQMNRSTGKIELVEVKSFKAGSADRAIVIMKVVPSKSSDKPFGLLYQHSGEGNMALCDVIDGTRPEDGILFNIGKELDR